MVRGTVFVVRLRVKSGNMQTNWNELDVNELRDVYEKESSKLKASLLSGTSWEELKELKDQRQKVTELAIALHKKINTSSNPAESTDRSEKRISR
jgi:hypothetical protein